MTMGKNPDCARTYLDGKFGKGEHILKSKDFRAVYKNGRSVKSSGFVLVFARNGLEHNRLGFSISSSSVRRSCARNRIRRLFREAYRKNKLLFNKAYDIVVIARKDPGKDLSYEDAYRILLSLANEAGILA